MMSYTNCGLNLILVTEGFLNSHNPEKQGILEFIAQAGKDSKKEQAVIDACHLSEGVNRLAVVYETMSLDLIKEVYQGLK